MVSFAVRCLSLPLTSSHTHPQRQRHATLEACLFSYSGLVANRLATHTVFSLRVVALITGERASRRCADHDAHIAADGIRSQGTRRVERAAIVKRHIERETTRTAYSPCNNIRTTITCGRERMSTPACRSVRHTLLIDSHDAVYWLAAEPFMATGSPPRTRIQKQGWQAPAHSPPPPPVPPKDHRFVQESVYPSIGLGLNLEGPVRAGPSSSSSPPPPRTLDERWLRQHSSPLEMIVQHTGSSSSQSPKGLVHMSPPRKRPLAPPPTTPLKARQTSPTSREPFMSPRPAPPTPLERASSDDKADRQSQEGHNTPPTLKNTNNLLSLPAVSHSGRHGLALSPCPSIHPGSSLLEATPRFDSLDAPFSPTTPALARTAASTSVSPSGQESSMIRRGMLLSFPDPPKREDATNDVSISSHETKASPSSHTAKKLEEAACVDEKHRDVRSKPKTMPLPPPQEPLPDAPAATLAKNTFRTPGELHAWGVDVDKRGLPRVLPRESAFHRPRCPYSSYPEIQTAECGCRDTVLPAGGGVTHKELARSAPDLLDQVAQHLDQSSSVRHKQNAGQRGRLNHIEMELNRLTREVGKMSTSSEASKYTPHQDRRSFDSAPWPLTEQHPYSFSSPGRFPSPAPDSEYNDRTFASVKKSEDGTSPLAAHKVSTGLGKSHPLSAGPHITFSCLPRPEHGIHSNPRRCEAHLRAHSLEHKPLFSAPLRLISTVRAHSRIARGGRPLISAPTLTASDSPVESSSPSRQEGKPAGGLGHHRNTPSKSSTASSVGSSNLTPSSLSHLSASTTATSIDSTIRSGTPALAGGHSDSPVYVFGHNTGKAKDEGDAKTGGDKLHTKGQPSMGTICEVTASPPDNEASAQPPEALGSPAIPPPRSSSVNAARDAIRLAARASRSSSQSKHSDSLFPNNGNQGIQGKAENGQKYQDHVSKVALTNSEINSWLSHFPQGHAHDNAQYGICDEADWPCPLYRVNEADGGSHYGVAL